MLSHHVNGPLFKLLTMIIIEKRHESLNVMLLTKIQLGILGRNQRLILETKHRI